LERWPPPEFNLSPRACSATFDAVILRRLLLLVLLALLLPGCVWHDVHSGGHYYRVCVTDPRGVLIADWIAEGWVLRTGFGYRFRAVERFSAGPWPQVVRYPHGRRVETSGPNIVVSPCPKPEWLEYGYGCVETHTRYPARTTIEYK
jgi:hypothetical protein